MTKKFEPKLAADDLPCGCPGSASRVLGQDGSKSSTNAAHQESELRQWPVQIKLVPVKAPYFENADLLVAADCAAYAYGNFHREFIRDKVTVIGCPKLDGIDYTEKLLEIISGNTINSLTVVRMEVPCCSGIKQAALNALEKSGKKIPCTAVTISVNGEVL